MRKEIACCDICKKDIPITKENEHLLGKKLNVVFTTETTEGRACKPYLSDVTVDICQDCLQKYIDKFQLIGWGAQGYNTYKFKGET